jgi:AraC-like DNA-binding protein
VGVLNRRGGAGPATSGCSAKQQSMIGCGTATFTDPDGYRRSVPGASIDLVLTGRGDFRARVTWVDTGRIRLVCCDENVPRIAFIAFAAERIFISLPMRHDPPPIWSGIRLGPSEIVLHGQGERSHQRTRGPGSWSFISIVPRILAGAFQTFMHTRFTPTAARIERAPSRPLGKLLRLHARACRLVETKPELIEHPEVTRALEQDLLHAIVHSVTSGKPHRDAATIARNAEVLAQFEDVLASHPLEHLSTPALAAAMGVPERTLRRRCAPSLGMSPGQYARLRRLNLVRTALRHADPDVASVGEIARHYGFSELGRFSVAYRTLFGESPSLTLHGASSQKLALTEIA